MEVDQIFTIRVLLRMSWTNEYLKWNPEEWGNITWLKMLSTDIWTPDIVPYNDMDEVNHLHWKIDQNKFKIKILLLDLTG